MCLYVDEAEWNRQCDEQWERIQKDPELRAEYEAWCEEMNRRDEEARKWEDAYIDDCKAGED